MSEQQAHNLPTLVVLASTYPRWKDDHEPGFVHEFTRRLTSRFQVIAVVPSAPGAAKHEVLDGVEVIRYRYAPRHLETLVNDGGIVTNLRRHRWKWLLVPTFVLGQVWRTWRLRCTRRIDVVHAHWLLPQGLIAASFSSTPYLVTSHGADLFAIRGAVPNALKRWVIRHAAAVTVVSEAMKEELLRIGANFDGIEVRPMGVDLVDRFTCDSKINRSINEILFVGRLVEKKGLNYLIDALPIILRKFPQAYLTVAGFGPEEAALREQVTRLNLDEKVKFCGAKLQDELPALYRRAAIFVAPFVRALSGDQDGLGLVSFEALGCGCPIVISDTPTTRDALPESDGCLRVVPRDSVALANGVMRVLADQQTHRRGAMACRESILCRYDWRSVSEGYGEILEACIRDGRSQD